MRDELFMKKYPVENFSAEQKKRIPYIEGRPDLFETKLFALKRENEEPPEKKILVATRDPGSGNALMPVIRELRKDPGLEIDVMTDGRAQEIIQNNFPHADITPENTSLEADNIIGTPDVLLMDRSSEPGIEGYMTATYNEVPKVLVEDYYTNTFGFIDRLVQRDLPLPERICVLDQRAKELIAEKYPFLAERIEVTGQPAFDRFYSEDTEKIARQTKEELGLKPEDKLVSYMSTMEELDKIREVAAELKNLNGDFYLAFRRHPRDNVSDEEYKTIFEQAGIKLINTDGFSTDEIGAASDVVLTTWSTEGLHGIYRRKPTVHFTDKRFRLPPFLGLPLPPVKLGASLGAYDPKELAAGLAELLDKDSASNKSLMTNMKKHYPADGKNAQRVADIVREYLK